MGGKFRGILDPREGILDREKIQKIPYFFWLLRAKRGIFFLVVPPLYGNLGEGNSPLAKFSMFIYVDYLRFRFYLNSHR